MTLGKISGAILALSVASSAFAVPTFAEGTRADEALGVWVRTKKDWLVEFKMCADNPDLLCGEVIAGDGLDKGTGESVVGVQMLYDLERHHRKDDRWVGSMYNPGDGHVYAGSVTVLDDGRIKMAGCMMKIMCRSEKWPRATDEQIAAAMGTEIGAYGAETVDAAMDDAAGMAETTAAEATEAVEAVAAPEAATEAAEAAGDSVMAAASDAAAEAADDAAEDATEAAEEAVTEAAEDAAEDAAEAVEEAAEDAAEAETEN